MPVVGRIFSLPVPYQGVESFLSLPPLRMGDGVPKGMHAIWNASSSLRFGNAALFQLSESNLQFTKASCEEDVVEYAPPARGWLEGVDLLACFGAAMVLLSIYLSWKTSGLGNHASLRIHGFEEQHARRSKGDEGL